MLLTTRLLPFVCLVVLFYGCKKETITPAVTQHPTSQHDLVQTKTLTGYLDNEPIELASNEPYVVVSYDSPNGNAYANGSANGNSNGTTNNGLALGRVRLTTGTRFNGGEVRGIAQVSGTVEIRKEIFRIYVTPFMVNSRLYHALNNGNPNFAMLPSGMDSELYLSVRDASGTLWTTNGDQTGSTFEITGVGNNLQTFTTVTGNVNCKMYDGNGNVKQFTQGSFIADFGLQ
jgi:hypothetical protein